MPYSTGMIVFAAGCVLVFVTFGYLLINARSLMALFKPLSGGEIKVGQGRQGASKAAVLWALIIHFAGWALAGLAWLYLLADVRATAPDTTPLEAEGIVPGKGESGR